MSCTITKTICKTVLFVILFLLWGANSIIAQTDTTYIVKFDQEFAAKISMTQKLASLSHENNSNLNLEYMANNPFAIGAGLSWQGMGVNISKAINYTDKKKGKTKSFDFQYHYYGKKVTFDLFVQNYKGFFLENRKENYTLFPDMKFTRYGVFGQYVFNGNKFSYRAAFDQSEIQLRSAGSLLLGGGAYYTKINYEDGISFHEKMYQIGPSIGYAYTYVFSKNYFVTGSFTPGLSFNFEDLNSKIDLNPTLHFKLASGYNTDKWSLNFSFLINRVYVSYSDDSQISVNSGSLQLTYIKRFDSKSRILKSLPSF
jgi:hypothetical protein